MTLNNIGKVIAALFGLFGGFLLKIAPPLDFGIFINGFAQMICLLVTLYIFRKNKSGKLFLKRAFLLSAITFILLGFIYYWQYTKIIVNFKREKIIKGITLTGKAIAYCNSIDIDTIHAAKECEEKAVDTFQNYSHYTKYTIWKNFLFNEIKMMSLYILMLSSLIIAVFSGLDYSAERKQ